MTVVRMIGNWIRRRWYYYVIAVALVALVTLLKSLAEPNLIDSGESILYIVAIALTATFFGLGPSIVASIISGFAFDYFFIVPLHTLGLPGSKDIPLVVILLMVGILISSLSTRLRQKNEQAAREIYVRLRSEEELARHRTKLEELINKRTEELENANLELKTDVMIRRQAEENLAQRTSELEAANKELEAFSYSVSHDLRAPLRSIVGFSHALEKDFGDVLSEEGREYLKYILDSGHTMEQLIDALLNLSRVTQRTLIMETVDMSSLAGDVVTEIRREKPDRNIDFAISQGMTVYGDVRLLRIVLVNLLGNAWKFTSQVPAAKVEFGSMDINSKRVFYVRDNGVGFDMDYADQLFSPFRRLHKASEFPGTGIGLALVQRIIRRHHGEIWAEGSVDNGAAFYFSLDNNDTNSLIDDNR